MATFKQYKELKTKYPDRVLIFAADKSGVYGAYNEDAQTVCGVQKLTPRTLAGVKIVTFPRQQLDNILPRLIRLGYHVAIVEQLERPELTKKLKRRITAELNT